MLLPDSLPKRQHTVLAFVLILAAAFLRFYHLDGQSIWNDEMFTIDVARLAFGDIQPALVKNFHHPPLYFYLVHAVFVIAGESLYTLRFLSAFFGTLTVWAVFRFTASRWNWKGGAIAGIICCVSPFHLAYSQEGRPYALAAFLALMGCHFFLRVIETGNRGSLTAYIITTLALLYTHHWGIFIVCAQGVSLIIDARNSRAGMKKFLIAAGIILLLYLPELPALKHQSASGGSAVWWWVEPPNANEALELSGAFSGTHFKMASSVFDSSVTAKFMGAGSLAIILFLSLFHLFSSGKDRSFRYLSTISIGALIIPIGLSFAKPEVFLWYRHTLIIYPLACVGMGAAYAVARWRIAIALCAGILILLGADGARRYYSWSKSNIREVASYVEEVTRAEKIILIRPAYVAPMLNYYYSGSAIQMDEAYLNTSLGMVVDTARSFVYVSLDVPNEIRTYMDGHFDKPAEKVFPGTAHMGLIVGVYKQKPEIEEEESEEK